MAYHETVTRYIFRCERDREYPKYHGEAEIRPDSKVEMVLSGDRTLPELCEEFCQFLKGCGFWLPPGGLEYVDEEKDDTLNEIREQHEESVDGPQEECARCNGITLDPEDTGLEAE